MAQAQRNAQLNNRHVRGGKSAWTQTNPLTGETFKRQGWKSIHPLTFQKLNADGTGLMRGGPGDKNHFISSAKERRGAGMMQQHMAGRLAALDKHRASKGLVNPLDAVPQNVKDRWANGTSIHQAGLAKPGERIDPRMGGITGQIRDYDAGHVGVKRIQDATAARNATYNQWRTEQGLTGGQQPTNQGFYDTYVKPTLDLQARRLADRRDPSDANDQVTAPWNPFVHGQDASTFDSWKAYQEGRNPVVNAEAENPAYAHLLDDSDQHLRDLGLLPGLTPTAEGLALEQGANTQFSSAPVRPPTSVPRPTPAGTGPVTTLPQNAPGGGKGARPAPGRGPTKPKPFRPTPGRPKPNGWKQEHGRPLPDKTKPTGPRNNINPKTGQPYPEKPRTTLPRNAPRGGKGTSKIGRKGREDTKSRILTYAEWVAAGKPSSKHKPKPRARKRGR